METEQKQQAETIIKNKLAELKKEKRNKEGAKNVTEREIIQLNNDIQVLEIILAMPLD